MFLKSLSLVTVTFSLLILLSDSEQTFIKLSLIFYISLIYWLSADLFARNISKISLYYFLYWIYILDT